MIITVRYVNFPRPGSSGKYGTLKLTDGSTLMCPVDLLEYFRANQQYDVPTKDQTWSNGPVTIVAGPPGGQNQAAGGYYGNGGYPRAVSRETATRPNTGFQPRVVQGGLGQPAKSHDQERMIFITGVVGRAMGSGKFAPSEIPVLLQAAAESFDRLVHPMQRTPANQQYTPPPDRPSSPHYGEPPADDPNDPGPVDPGMSG